MVDVIKRELNNGTAEEPEDDSRNCFDHYMLTDEVVQEYLNEDKNNFVIKLPAPSNNYECLSMDYLKSQWTVSEDDRPDLTQPYYKKWYECKVKNNLPSPTNVITNVSYIKIGSSLFLVEKPDWIYNGSPPEPRIFELQPSKQVETITSSDMIDGNQINYISGDHCNTEPLLSYKLVKTPNTRAYAGLYKRNKKTKTKKSKTKTKHSIGKKHKMRKATIKKGMKKYRRKRYKSYEQKK